MLAVLLLATIVASTLGQTDKPFGTLQFKSLSSCYHLLDVTRPIPGSYPFSYNTRFYRRGSRFGRVYDNRYIITSPLFTPRLNPPTRFPIRIQPDIVRFDGVQGRPVALPLSSGRSSGPQALPLQRSTAQISSLQAPQSLRAAQPQQAAATARVGSVSLKSGTTTPAFSETNNQVAGIDEADIVKTDGQRIYAIGGRTLLVYKASSKAFGAKPAELARINLNRYLDAGGFVPIPAGVSGVSSTNEKLAYGGAKTFSGSDILIQGSKILVIGQARQSVPIRYPYFDPWLGWVTPRRTLNTVVVLVLDLGFSVKFPRLVGYHEVEGSYVTARKTGGIAYLVLGQAPFLDKPTSFNIQSTIRARRGLTEADILPVWRSSSGASFRPVSRCSSIGYIPGLFYQSMITVTGISINTGRLTGSASVLGPWQSGSPSVVAYSDSLYVGLTWEDRQPWYNRFSGSGFFGSFTRSRGTALLAFTLSNGKISYRAVGQAPGRLLNQFSLDEYDGFLRVAITTDGFGTQRTNAVYTYDKKTLSQVGKVTNLAPGERIFSVRFIGDRGYIVTFRQVDPLFVIDLAVPQLPRVLGELKIPGFSDYLHPAGPKKLLGFGKSATEQGRTTGLKIALFDVSNPTKPREQGVLELGGPGSSSEILTDQKALLYQGSGPRGAWFVLPVRLSSTQDNCLFGSQKQNFAGKPRSNAFVGAYVVAVDLDSRTSGSTFKILTSFSHLKSSQNRGNTCRKTCSSAEVKRALFVGDLLYTLSDQEIQAASLSAVFGGFKPQPLWKSTLFKNVGGLPSFLQNQQCTVYV